MNMRSPGPSATRELSVRRPVRPPDASGLADGLVPGDPIFSHLMATLSAIFPPGEEFFVATVREHRDVVADDPVRRAQVKAFCGQEAMHGRGHRTLNEGLDRLGYRTAAVERHSTRVFDALHRLRPRTLPLAVTAAAEHLTGIFAEATLGDESTRETLFPDPHVQPLITWHALEELEHKNVAFDVLARSGSGYVVRVAGWMITVSVLATTVVLETAVGVARDRKNIGRAELRTHVRNRQRQRLVSPWAARRLLRYLRPGFHPDDMDTEGLVQEWRARLADQVEVTAGADKASV